MGQKQKQGKTPAAKKDGPKRKRCKAPRGVKQAKVIDQLLIAVDKPHKRHRNGYNHRMAQVTKLARLL